MLTQWGMVALGGAIGAVLRFYISETFPSEAFPWATLSVNLIGSVLLGALTAFAAANLVSETTALLLGAGVLGAFTTMSTFSVETAMLIDEERWVTVIGYVAATAVIGPLLALASWKGTQHLVG